MNIQEVSKLKAGTKVYKVQGAKITGYYVLSTHPKGYDYVYLIHDDDVRDCTGFFLNMDLNTYFTTDYLEAKEKMWEQLQNKVNHINENYMKGTKSVSFD